MAQLSIMPMNTRAVAAKIVGTILNRKASLSTLLPKELDRVNQRDRGLLQELCYGTLRWQTRLDFYTQHLLQKPLKSKDTDIQALLLIGLYQINFMRIPDHAAVKETVAATKALNKPWAKGLVNGVLRSFVRQKENIDHQFSRHPLYLSSHPQWLTDLIHQHWPQQAEHIFDANNQNAPMTLRVNQRITSQRDYLETLASHNIPAKACHYSAVGIQLDQPIDVGRLPGFYEGHVSVQDEAPQLTTPLLDLKQQQRVLDACAAPGGKTCHILESEPNLASVVAVDLDSQRLNKIEENLQRLKLEATVICHDASILNGWWNGESFDRILLDVPCSATGVIRRHPDIKLLRRATDINQLSTLQMSLLNSLWKTLKCHGILVYATCSILAEENDQVISAFIAATKDAEVEVINADWGLATEFGRQLLPQALGHDGFYCARLRKIVT